MKNPKILYGLNHAEYEHPFDKAALQTLEKTPALPLILKAFNKNTLDKLFKLQHAGSKVEISDSHFPKLYQLFLKACEILNVKTIPKFYLFESYNVDAYATGFTYPIVSISSGLLERFTEQELLFILGHELGHIKSEHLLYHQLSTWLPIIGRFLGYLTLGIGDLVATGLQYSLLYWYRMSEYTSDRAGLLTVQDKQAAISALSKLGGYTTSTQYGSFSTEAYLGQVDRFEDLDFDQLDKLVKNLAIMESTHPWTTLRVKYIKKWFEQGDYENILNRNRSR
jgi:Zn-dependent protease with chaperone function